MKTCQASYKKEFYSINIFFRGEFVLIDFETFCEEEEHEVDRFCLIVSRESFDP